MRCGAAARTRLATAPNWKAPIVAVALVAAPRWQSLPSRSSSWPEIEHSHQHLDRHRPSHATGNRDGEQQGTNATATETTTAPASDHGSLHTARKNPAAPAHNGAPLRPSRPAAEKSVQRSARKPAQGIQGLQLDPPAGRAGDTVLRRWPPAKPRPSIVADVVVVGAGAAGLYAALCAAREGARVRARLGHAARADGQLLGAGRARRGARRRRQLRAAPRGHRARGARRSSGAPRPRSSCARRPTCVRDLQALGVRFDARPLRAARPRARGRALGAARRPRGRQRDGPARRAPALRARRRGAAHHRARGRARPSAVDPGGPLPRPGLRRRADPRRARGRARHRRRGGAVGAHDQPARLASASGCCSPTPPARSSPTSSCSSSIRRPSSAARARGLPRHGGDPRRGRDAARRLRRALRRRARPRDEVSRAIQATLEADRRALGRP